MRQAARSGIALAAVAVSAGRLPERSRELAAGGDFEIREICDTAAIVPRVVSLVTDELPSLFDVDPRRRSASSVPASRVLRARTR